MDQLGLQQTRHMTPRAEVAGLIPGPGPRATLATCCSGMRLQIWRKRLNRLRVGLVFCFFIPVLWEISQSSSRHFLLSCAWCALNSLEKWCLSMPPLEPFFKDKLRLEVTGIEPSSSLSDLARHPQLETRK